jgi:hypothetical protein
MKCLLVVLLPLPPQHLPPLQLPLPTLQTTTLVLLLRTKLYKKLNKKFSTKKLDFFIDILCRIIVHLNCIVPTTRRHHTWQDWMKRCFQTGSFVRLPNSNCRARIIVIQMNRPICRTRNYHASIWTCRALDWVPIHSMPFKALPKSIKYEKITFYLGFIQFVWTRSRKNCYIISI